MSEKILLNKNFQKEYKISKKIVTSLRHLKFGAMKILKLPPDFQNNLFYYAHR